MVSNSSCSIKLSTIVDKKICLGPNKENSSIIYGFYNNMQEKGSSENHQIKNLKVVLDPAKFLKSNVTFYNIKREVHIISFLYTKIKILI